MPERSAWNKHHYHDDLVAMVRAACHARMGHKLIAKASGLSLPMVEKISQNERSPEVRPHPDFTKRLRSLFVSNLSDAGS